MEPIDAGDIPLEEVVRELFSEEGLRKLLGRYDTACFVLARAGLQPRFFQELIENIDTVDETTRDQIAFIVFHGNRSTYIRENDYEYSFHLNGLSVSGHRDPRRRIDDDENVSFAPKFRRALKDEPNSAPFRNIGRATDFAASLLMQRFDVRETSLPCLLFVASDHMDEPQVVRLSPSEPMDSLYRDVLAPLSDELRVAKKRDEQRSEISSAENWYRYSKNTLAEYPAKFDKLNRELEAVRAEIAQILEDRPETPADALKSERDDLEAIRRSYKSAKNLDERVAIALGGPYAQQIKEMGQRLDALIEEMAQLDSGASDDEIQKRRHALSSSIGRLKSKLGTLATKPASEAANRIDWINAKLRRIEASDPIKSLRQTEDYLTGNLASLTSYRDSAQKVVDAYSEAAVDTKRQKVAGTEEQLRRHGFPVALFQAERISAFDVVKVLNSTGAIGYSKTDRRGGTTRPIPLSATPQKMLLLFMHGLGGAREATWGNFPSLLTSDKEIADRYAVDYYTFPTQLFRLPFSPRAPKIQVLADGLRAQIKYAGYERVSLLCHSLGGLIAKQYLIEELEANRDLRVDRVVFIAVPNNGSDLAAAGSLLSWRQHQLRQLQKDADIIEFSNKAWRRLEVRNRVRLKYIVGSQDRVVDRLSAEEYWGNPDVETVLGCGHIDIVKPNGADDMVVKIVKHFLLS